MVSVRQHEASAVGFDERTSEREADAAVAALVAVEDGFGVAGFDSRAVIVDLDDETAMRATGDDPGLAGAMAQRVFEKDVQSLLDRAASSGDAGQVGVRCDEQFPPGIGVDGPPPAHDVIENRSCFDKFGFRQCVSRKGEHVIDDALETVRFGGRCDQVAPIKAHAERSQRSSQLMGGVGAEFTLTREEFRELSRRNRERVVERVELRYARYSTLR